MKVYLWKGKKYTNKSIGFGDKHEYIPWLYDLGSIIYPNFQFSHLYSNTYIAVLLQDLHTKYFIFKKLLPNLVP